MLHVTFEQRNCGGVIFASIYAQNPLTVDAFLFTVNDDQMGGNPIDDWVWCSATVRVEMNGVTVIEILDVLGQSSQVVVERPACVL